MRRVFLVRTGGARGAGSQPNPNVVAGQVEPSHRKARLEQHLRARGLGEHNAVVLHPDTAAAANIDAAIRVSRVSDD